MSNRVEILLPPLPNQTIMRTLNLPGDDFLLAEEVEAIAHGLAEFYKEPLTLRWIRSVVETLEVK